MQAKHMTITLTSGHKTLVLGEGHPYRLRSVQGQEAAPVAIASAPNAGMHGDTVTNVRLEARSLVLGGTIAYLDDLERLRERLARFLSPHEEGLCTIDYCGTKRQIGYRVEAFSIDEMANLWAPMDFSITLFCADPMLRSTDSYGRNIAEYLPQFALPFCCTAEKKSIMGYRKTSNTFVLKNDGDTAVGLKAVIAAVRGPVNDPVLKNEATGQQIGMKMTLAQGDTLTISTLPRQKQILLNGENAMMKMDRTSDLTFALTPGDNLLCYEAADGRSNMDVRLYYTPEYLGV